MAEIDFAGLVEHAPDALIVVDQDGVIRYVNRRAEQVTGYDAGELLGRGVDVLVPAGVRVSHAGHRRRYAARPVVRRMAVGRDPRLRRRDGSEVPVDVRLGPGGRGQAGLVTAVLRHRTAAAGAREQVGGSGEDAVAAATAGSGREVRAMAMGTETEAAGGAAAEGAASPAQAGGGEGVGARAEELTESARYEDRARLGATAEVPGPPAGDAPAAAGASGHAEEGSAGRDARAGRRVRELTVVADLCELLQGCMTEAEVLDVTERCAGRLFPDRPGVLSLRTSAGHAFETRMRWAGVTGWDEAFGPTDCWALRRGRPHVVAEAAAGPVCPHLLPRPPGGYVCAPMAASEEVLGLLHVQAPDRPVDADDADLVTRVAALVGGTIANLRARERLRHQSIRDDLTGLFNRRYMEESLERELQRAERNADHLAVAMLDIDHFKDVNDTYGHVVGDRLLRQLGLYLDSHVRGGDITCRYGGEEFLIVLPGCGPDVAWARVEELRLAVEEVGRAVLGGDPAQSVTISAGLAIFPEDGEDAAALVAAADEALYLAKVRGRNRMEAAPAGGGDQRAGAATGWEGARRDGVHRVIELPEPPPQPG